MPNAKQVVETARTRTRTKATLKKDVAASVDALKCKSSRKHRKALKRYGIPTGNALGVPMKEIQALGRRLRPDHELALALWKTGFYEARILVAYVADPRKLTVLQMNAWSRDFDSWAVVDTLCLALFCDSKHAWG